MKINILANGCEENFLPPAKEGDIGYDIRAKSVEIVGDETEEGSGLYRSIDYIEYDTGVVLEPALFSEIHQSLGLGEGVEVVTIPEEEFFTLCLPRSGVSGYNLQLCNSVGVIDIGYRGTLRARYNYIFQPEDYRLTPITNEKAGVKGFFSQATFSYAVLGVVNPDKIFKVGDKVIQAVFARAFWPETEVVDQASGTERGSDGFNSTGR